MELGAAVTARVEERAELAAAIAEHDHRRAADHRRDVRVRRHDVGEHEARHQEQGEARQVRRDEVAAECTGKVHRECGEFGGGPSPWFA